MAQSGRFGLSLKILTVLASEPAAMRLRNHAFLARLALSIVAAGVLAGCGDSGVIAKSGG
jgi:hypothetical protein